jgi:hypothetical protein
MDDHNIKDAIDLSLDRAALLWQKGIYDRIMFSCSEDDRRLIGTGIFKKTLGKDVIEYVSAGIHTIPTRVVTGKSFKSIRTAETKLLGFALLVEGYCRARAEVHRLETELAKCKSARKRPNDVAGDIMLRQSQMHRFVRPRLN